MKNIRHQTSNFKSKITNVDDITKETAKFWYDEAETSLKSLHDVIDDLEDRAYRIMTFSGIAAASFFTFIGFFKATGNTLSGFFLLPAIVAFILYTVIFICCFYATKQEFIVQLGMEPRKSMDPAFIKANDTRQYENVILAATESYQAAIDRNLQIIDTKSTWLQRCFLAFAASPIIIGLFFLGEWLWLIFCRHCLL